MGRGEDRHVQAVRNALVRKEDMSRQHTLFDMAMRDELEAVTCGYQSLWRDLEQARARIHGLEEEHQRLTQRINELETEASLRQWEIIIARCQAHGPHSADDVRAELTTALTHLAAEVHPDRWQDSAVAEELTKRVLALRDKVKRAR